MRNFYLSDYKFKALLFVFSAAVHAALFIAVMATYAQERKNPAVVIDLSQNKKVPFALSVSLTGRRGNTYDRSKRVGREDIEKLKKIVVESMIGVREKAGEMKRKYDSISADAAREKKRELEFSEAKKRILDAAENAFKKLKKNAVAKVSASSEVEIAEKKPGPLKKAPRKTVKKPEPVITDELAAGRNTPGRDINAGPAGPVTTPQLESFGNLSGNESDGDRLAGAPHGDADPSIEANSIDIFKSAVVEKIKRNLKYPDDCRQRGVEGTVRLAFEVGSGGRVNFVSVEESSGDNELDEAAVSSVSEGAPYLPIPEILKGRPVSFKIPLNFKLK